MSWLDEERRIPVYLILMSVIMFIVMLGWAGKEFFDVGYNRACMDQGKWLVFLEGNRTCWSDQELQDYNSLRACQEFDGSGFTWEELENFTANI